MYKYTYKTLKQFIKPHDNSSNQAKRQMFEAKTVKNLNYSSLEAGCDLCLQRLRYQSTEKLYKKVTKLKKLKIFFWKQVFPKSIKGLRFQQKAIN